MSDRRRVTRTTHTRPMRPDERPPEEDVIDVGDDRHALEEVPRRGANARAAIEAIGIGLFTMRLLDSLARTWGRDDDDAL